MEAPFVLSTVYVFIGENTALLDFMFAMNDTGLLNDGEYVVVAVDNSNDDPISNNTCEKFIIPHIFFRDINLRYALKHLKQSASMYIRGYVWGSWRSNVRKNTVSVLIRHSFRDIHEWFRAVLKIVPAHTVFREETRYQ